MPAVQAAQTLLEVALQAERHWPGAHVEHAVQELAPAADQVPAAQAEQTRSAVATHGEEMKVPAAQGAVEQLAQGT